MRVVVLGARGLIGGAVVRRARLAGHQVRAVVRPGHGAPGFPAGIEVVPADLRVRESVVEAVRGIDIVVHAATVPYPEWPQVVPLLAENALAAAEAMGATLVFPGNVYVYGHPRSRFVTEDHPQEPDTVKGRVRLGVERRPSTGTGHGERTGSVGRRTKIPPSPSRRTRGPRPAGIPGCVRLRWDARGPPSHLRGRAHGETVPLAARCRRAPRVHPQRRRGRSDSETHRDSRGAWPGRPRPGTTSDRGPGLHPTRLRDRGV